VETLLAAWFEPTTGEIVMQLIMEATGEEILLGHHTVQAVQGPYRGTWWQIDDVVAGDAGYRVHASRKHPLGRHRIVVPPHVFGLIIREAQRLMLRVLAWFHGCLSELNTGLIMGVIALIPLAFFEQAHGAEAVAPLIEWLREIR
jgi:hypothetical protein